MSTKRTPRYRDLRPAVSPAAVEAWRRARELGKREGWVDAHKALHRELGIPWFDHSPLHVTSEKPPDYVRRNGQAPEWRLAWELRQALLAAQAAAAQPAVSENVAGPRGSSIEAEAGAAREPP